MASTIITKNSSTASAVPVVGDLTKGELAVNVTDKKIYTKDNSAAVVKLVGSLGNQEANAVAITGGSIAGITDLAVADGGTGASTASDARTNLGLGTIATQAASSVTITGGSVTGITDITVADGGTGASTASNARTNLGAAASGANSDITSLSGLTTALSVAQGGTGITSFGSGVATFLGTPSSANLLAAVTDETGTGALVFANSPTLVTPALGTPSALVGTNITGTASGLTAGNVTTNANLTGAVTSVGNATSLGSFSSANLLGALTDETGTGSAVFATSPTLVTPILGTPTSATLTNATGLPISTGVSGLGTGVATALAVNVGSAGAPVVNGGALGTPSSGTATNLTGLPLSTGVTGTLPTTNGGTGLTSFTANGVLYASSTSALTSGSALTFDGSALTTKGTTYGNVVSAGASASAYAQFQGYTGNGDASNVNFAILGNKTGSTYLGIPNGGVGIDVVYGNSFTFALQETEQMRLTLTGLGIGTSSPGSFKLKAVGTGGNLSGNAYFVGLFGEGAASNKGVGLGYDSTSQTGIIYGETASVASNLAFWTYSGSAWGERARITSGGYSKFSNNGSYTGSTSTYHEFYQTENNIGLFVRATNGSYTNSVLEIYGDRNTTNATYNLINAYNGAISGQFIVRDSGNAVNTNNSYGAISDIKLKENITDATPKLANLMQVQVRNYNLKSSPEHKQLGVIAQELEQVFPSMVEESVDRDEEGNDLGTTTKQVKYSVFVPMLIKAMQEQQAIINQLKARLDAANL